MWHSYHVEVKFPTPCQETEQISSKLHEKASQDQVERQDHNIHLHHTVISVLQQIYFFRLLCMSREHLKE